jgi:hypothetical protein
MARKGFFYMSKKPTYPKEVTAGSFGHLNKNITPEQARRLAAINYNKGLEEGYRHAVRTLSLWDLWKLKKAIKSPQIPSKSGPGEPLHTSGSSKD